MIWETILLGLRSIRRNVLRSTLTILGIVIGVASVITMVTLGSGATAQVTSDIKKMGSNMLHVHPGSPFRGPGGARAKADKFKTGDVEAILENVAGIAAAAPSSSDSGQAVFGNSNWSTTIMGSTGDYLTVRNWRIEEGRSFTPAEEHAGAAVCLLGKTVLKELFGGQDPLGSTIRLKNLSCQVVGVLESKGQASFGQDQDDTVIIPIRTFQRRIAGNTDVSSIFVSASDGVSTSKVKEDIEQLMRERRRIAEGKEDDFDVMDMQEIVQTLTGTTRILTALLGAVAAVSLLVGGIGIMNIMLVSVTERTREIGIRLAIGALEKDVLMQFLIEAVVLSSTGGLLGIVLGFAAAGFGAHLLGMPLIIRPGIFIVAFLFSAFIGVVFGFFPARQAARLDPIEALRHE